MSRAPKLVAFSDQLHHPDSVSSLCELCSEAKPGEVVIVLRDRELATRERYFLGQHLLSAVRRGGQLLVVSDRADMARALEADGLHLPAAGFTPRDARRAQGSRIRWLSRSGHGLEGLSDAELVQLTATAISPVWEARKGRAALGTLGLSEQVRELKKRAPALLIYALGGISAENASKSLECGADGVAAMGVLRSAPERTRLLSALEILR